MSEDTRTASFETPGPTKLRIGLPSGRINVTVSERATTQIELSAPHGDAQARDWVAQAEMVQIGDEIVVRGPKLGFQLFGGFGRIEATVLAPLGSDASLSIGAGRIATVGRMGRISASTGAGQIKLDDCAEARARTGSGDIEIASVSGSVDTKTGAGQVSVGKVGVDARIVTAAGNARVGDVAGAASFQTAHGNVEVERAGDSLDIFTASGNIDVGHIDHGWMRARTVSGRLSVGVAKGVAALLDVSTLSGRVHSELSASNAPGDDEQHVELTLNTVSGNVTVARA